MRRKLNYSEEVKIRFIYIDGAIIGFLNNNDIIYINFNRLIINNAGYIKNEI